MPLNADDSADLCDINHPENDYIRNHVARQTAMFVQMPPVGNATGPWVNDGDRWCCDYCNANPRTIPLPSSCHACGSVSAGGVLASYLTASAGVMPLMALIIARGD